MIIDSVPHWHRPDYQVISTPRLSFLDQAMIYPLLILDSYLEVDQDVIATRRKGQTRRNSGL